MVQMWICGGADGFLNGNAAGDGGEEHAVERGAGTGRKRKAQGEAGSEWLHTARYDRIATDGEESAALV